MEPKKSQKKAPLSQRRVNMPGENSAVLRSSTINLRLRRRI